MRWLSGSVIALGIVLAGGVRPLAVAPAASLAARAIAPGSSGVVLDGDLSDAAWSPAVPVRGFLQRDPREGEPATHETDVRVVYDGRALYVAVMAHDPEPDQIVGLLTRRDEQSPSDWVRITIDSYRDRRTAYEFAVNAAGVKQDRYWFADTSVDPSWDAVWDVAVKRTPQGWSAEFQIPFSQLRFNPASSDAFGFAVARTVAHVNETSTWPLLARSASGYVSSFGQLTGLAFAGSQKKLEIMPYALAEVKTAPVAPGNPLVSSPKPQASVGLDMKYKVAPGLTLTATINPDFGQVEADPAVVNLGAFETFFAEQRPFFVEGSGNFSFNVDCNDGRCTGLFYSRRIGRAPHRFVSAPEGGFSAQPASSTIAGATKLTGRIGKFTIGALNAITTREEAEIASGPDLGRSRSPVEPATSYSVGRVSREFADNSRVSFLMTSTNRRLTEELRFLPSSAVTGGVDADVRLGGRYSVTGFWAGSDVRGSADAIDRLQRSNVHSFQRPDAGHLAYDPLRTSLSGHAASASVNKISGQRVRFSSNAGYKSPGFDINDLGFHQRADEINQSNWFQIRDDQPGRFVRNVSVNFNQWAGWNFDGDRRYTGLNINAHWVFLNNWSSGFGVNANLGGVADRSTRGGPVVRTNGDRNAWAYMNTDNRKALSASLDVFGLRDGHGSSAWDLSPRLTWRPRAALSISGGVGLGRNVSDSQWVQNVTEDGRTRYVFGRIDQTTLRLSARVNYTITPTLSIQVYAQPFVSAGAYTTFKELTDGRAARYEDRYAPFAFAGDPDFNVRSFRTTNVLRWEFRPGSALFVVWQQGRDAFVSRGDFQFGRDFGGVFDAPATNVFLVKISRWMNF